MSKAWIVRGDEMVFSVAPGLIDDAFDPLSDEAKRAHAESLPLKRLGAVADVAGAFVFLASEEGCYSERRTTD